MDQCATKCISVLIGYYVIVEGGGVAGEGSCVVLCRCPVL